MNKEYLKQLQEGYFDNNVIRFSLIDGFPQQIAKTLSESKPAMSTKQARSFFDNVNALVGKTAAKRISFNEAKAELLMLKSRIYDKVAKGTVSVQFKQFFESNVSAINTTQDLKAFAMHFEAVCNYLKDVSAKQDNDQSYKGFKSHKQYK